MAKVRIGFSTQFELENELVGIGTDNPTNTLQALGNIKSSDAKVIGVSTLTTYQGFVDTKAAISGAAGAKSGSTSGEIIIEGSVVVSSGTTFTSGPEKLTVTDDFTLPGISDDKPSVGTTRFNEYLGALEFYNGVEWRAVNSYIDIGNRGRGVWMGCFNDISYYLGVMDYFNMSSTGNSINFGELLTVDFYQAGASNSIRGLSMGGIDGPSVDNMISYITLASEGNSVDFGNLTEAVMYNPAACSSSTRAVRCGGANNPSPNGAVNTMDYVEIMTVGNAIDFGDLYIGVRGTGGCSNGTRGLVMGGTSGASPSNVNRDEIQQFTISSKGNSFTFGNLTAESSYHAVSSNSVRAIRMGGGYQPAIYVNTIDWVTIQSEGNAVDFGDITYLTRQNAGTASQTRAFTSGGYDGSTYLNTMDYVTIASTGNTVDFGERVVGSSYHAGCSDSHGGLGGF